MECALWNCTVHLLCACFGATCIHMYTCLYPMYCTFTCTSCTCPFQPFTSTAQTDPHTVHTAPHIVGAEACTVHTCVHVDMSHCMCSACMYTEHCTCVHAQYVQRDIVHTACLLGMSNHSHENGSHSLILKLPILPQALPPPLRVYPHPMVCSMDPSL